MPQKLSQVFVFDDLKPEDNAMLQALYSRSPASVVTHLDKVRQSGSGNFMEKFYVGYGHASIGDCGNTTIFIEQVSMLVAKAVQDWALYSGQEASTRYLDFAQQAVLDPYNTPETTAIQQGWMTLYNTYLPKVKEAVAARYPYNEAEYKSETIWRNAVNARAFDMMRAFLPVGTTTLLSWTTNLRQAREKLMQLKVHPLQEVRDVAQKIFAELKSKYGNSFTGDEMAEGVARYAERDAYANAFAETTHFESADDVAKRLRFSEDDWESVRNGDLVVNRQALDAQGLAVLEKDALTKRPKGADLPRRLASYGNYNVAFLIDFGSFRDIQRHRNGTCQNPLIDGRFGMHSEYMRRLEESLSAEDYQALEAETNRLLSAIANVGEPLKQHGQTADVFKTQYLFPMGVSILCHVGYSVPQMVYVGELRSQKTVHFTLRPIAQDMLRTLEHDFPCMALHGDMDADDWTAKRGTQTIMEKTA